MNEPITRQAQAMFGAVQDARIPDAVQKLAADSVVQTRAVYDRMRAVAYHGGDVLEEVLLSAESGARAIKAKVLDHSVANTEALFDAAQAIARAGTFPAAAQLQSKFVQQQLVAVSEQSRELFDLYAKVTTQTFDSMSKAAAKMFEQSKTAG